MGNLLGIGVRLREERERLGMSQDEFASIAAVTRKTLFGYETDVRAPDAAALAVWANAGVDLLYVVTGQRVSVAPVRQPLNQREAALLDNYRHSNEQGKKAVETTASAFAKSTVGKAANGGE